MLLSTIESPAIESRRIERLKQAVQDAKPAVCPERARIWTAYYKKKENRTKSPHVQVAEALRDVLLNKRITIYPDELIVGNFTSKRVGGAIFPELHGVPVMFDILKFSRRKTNPLAISAREIRQLVSVIPFWLLRFMPFKAYRSPLAKVRFIANQLRAHFYLINECGGISHLAPDYEKLIAVGTAGIAAEAARRQETTVRHSDSWYFLDGVQIIAEGLAAFGERYADLAAKMAVAETDPVRKAELMTIAAVCRNSLRNGAGSFHEALQIIFFTQIAINQESLDNSVCPGRMDQYLYPYYTSDLASGRLDRERAKELIAAFSIKMSEIIPVFSKQLTDFHGGMFNGQVVTVGGVDRDGNDATNELSIIFLEVMDELRMRQPNFHARVHAGSPDAYYHKLCHLLANGSNSPALYNDEVIVGTMRKHGYAVEDARDYTAVGCVEPVSQGKSFSSTDAAIFNVPIILEMALNRGRRFGSPIQTGPRTPSVGMMRGMADVTRAFETQLKFMMARLIKDLQAVEIANRDYHPTPLTSMLLDGCISLATCSTAGGARYNFSGIQCVGPVDVGDALYAIEKAVFIDRRMTLQQVVDLLRNNINSPEDYRYMKSLEKFGNDHAPVDRWTTYVIETFVDVLATMGKNTRGGEYTTGLYSVTAHEFFGRITAALPNGRRKGEPFSSGISPQNGADRNGPTALLNSMNRIDFTRIANGINFNIKFSPHTLRGDTGRAALESLLKTYFRRGGMQTQVNVLDPDVLVAARDNPEQYPNLLVRVSGYSAYFNDLAPPVQNELIRRTCLTP